MNKVVQKLLLEIMNFRNNREFKKEDIYINKIKGKIDELNIYTRLGELLTWINPRFHFSFTDLEKYVIYEDFMEEETIKEITEQFSLLFKYIPELNEIFVFEDRVIKFNPSLNKADIQEIYNFVKTNYVINPSHISRYIRPTKE